MARPFAQEPLDANASAFRDDFDIGNFAEQFEGHAGVPKLEYQIGATVRMSKKSDRGRTTDLSSVL